MRQALLLVVAIKFCWFSGLTCSRALASNWSPDYFDRLRQTSSNVTQLLLAQASQDNNNSYTTPTNGSSVVGSTTTSHIFQVVDDQTGQVFRLADIISFLPFSSAGTLREGIHNDAAAAILAARDFNNAQQQQQQNNNQTNNQTTIVVLDEYNYHALSGCNVKITLEIVDTEFSPIESTKLFTTILQRNTTDWRTPIPASVMGAYRSATTSPLAILTGVNDIPQVSPASTSTDFDVKEQYPRFGRTITSSIGEAQAALDLFVRIWNSTNVGILFVTVRVSFLVVVVAIGWLVGLDSSRPSWKGEGPMILLLCRHWFLSCFLHYYYDYYSGRMPMEVPYKKPFKMLPRRSVSSQKALPSPTMPIRMDLKLLRRSRICEIHNFDIFMSFALKIIMRPLWKRQSPYKLLDLTMYGSSPDSISQPFVP